MKSLIFIKFDLDRILVVFVALLFIPLSASSEPKEPTLCITKTGAVAPCLCTLPNTCFPLRADGQASNTPFDGNPLVLSEKQSKHYLKMQSKKDTLFIKCLTFQKESSTLALPSDVHTPIEGQLWSLVLCLKHQLNTEFDPKQEKLLIERLTQVLNVLLNYPNFKAEAHYELGNLAYFKKTYRLALRHYLEVPKEKIPYILVSRGWATCKQAHPQCSISGVKLLIRAIEQNMLPIKHVDSVEGAGISLTHIYTQCGCKHLNTLIQAKNLTLQKALARTKSYLKKLR